MHSLPSLNPKPILFGEFSSNINLKNLITHAKDFFREKFGPNSPDFFKGLKYVAKNIEGLLYIYFFWYVVYSQIWLNFLVDDCYFGYMGEEEKKTTDLNYNKKIPE